jgi:hypothetical protein
MQVEYAGKYEKPQFFQAVYLALGQSKQKRMWRLVFIIIIGLLAGLLVVEFQNEVATIVILVTALSWIAYILRPEVNTHLTVSHWWQDQAIGRNIKGSVSHQGLVYGTSEQTWENFLDLRATDDLVVLLRYDVRNLNAMKESNQLPTIPDPRRMYYEPARGASFLRKTKPDHLAQKRGDLKTQPNPWAISGQSFASVSEVERYMLIFPRSFFQSDVDWKEFRHLVAQHVGET